MPHFTRRRFLQFTATGTAAALAGCAGGSSDATHADWLPQGDDYTLTAYIDLSLTGKTARIDPLLPLILPSDEDGGPERFLPVIPEFEDIDDPLVTFPLRTGGQIIGVGSLSLAVAGLGYLVDPDATDAGVTELFLANDTVVGTGEIDTDRADEALRSGSTNFLGELRFEAVGENGEYTIYQPTMDDPATAAVSESAVVAGDTRADVQTVLAARRGDRQRATEASDALGWLFENAGDGDILVGWRGPVELGDFYWGDPESQPGAGLVSGRDDVVSSVTFAPESDEITADFALQNQDSDEDAKTRLASRLGAASDDATVSVDAERLTAAATYAGDALNVSFHEPQATTEQTTVPGGDDLPEEVAAAVPDNAFEFEYQESQNTVRVNFVASVDASEVTVRALESGGETSTTTPEVVTYLNVFVAAGGDEVVVTVTVDGVSGVVARREFG